MQKGHSDATNALVQIETSFNSWNRELDRPLHPTSSALSFMRLRSEKPPKLSSASCFPTDKINLWIASVWSKQAVLCILFLYRYTYITFAENQTDYVTTVFWAERVQAKNTYARRPRCRKPYKWFKYIRMWKKITTFCGSVKLKIVINVYYCLIDFSCAFQLFMILSDQSFFMFF